LADELNVRQGPGLSFPVLYVAHKGDVLIVQSKNLEFDNSPWFLIRIKPDGSEEWITGDTKYVKRYNVANLSYRRAPETPAPTPTPAPPEPDPHFRADRTSISAGECTTLHWDVDNVKAVKLDGHGQVGHGSTRVCPSQTQTFTLTVVQRDGRRVEHSITIQVSGQRSYPPLAIEWHLNGKRCISRGEYIAEFSVWATGGNGSYTYYSDGEKIGGPVAGGVTYQLRWGACCGAPGTFIVRSGDGQEAQKEFWVDHPDCSTY
jgi:hypothetical protein